MKEIALQITRESKGRKLNTLREYLQNYILFIMQKVGMSASLYFVGGTALRFLHQTRRYSEDLDFSASDNWNPSDFSTFVEKIESHLIKAAYSCTINTRSEKVVQRVMIGFPGLLYEAGLSQRKDQKLAIHVEIDINPPGGWNSEKTIVDLHLPVVLQHYDLASMYAGKLHAVLMRPFAKGRDIYDLFWYRTKHKELRPNFTLLNNAIAQTTGDFVKVNRENWLDILNDKVRRLDWDAVKNDVLPFLEFQDDLMTFTQDNLLMLLKNEK